MLTITIEQINDYTAYLVSQERASGTIAKYRRDIGALERFLDGEALTRERAAEWKNYLQEQGYASRTINSMLAAANGFFRLDEDGNVTITDPDGADVTFPGKDPENVKVPEGTVIKPNGEVTLTYTLKYVDDKGKDLEAAELVQLKPGETEKVKALSINGYNLKGEAVKTITGALSTNLNDYVILFTYEKQNSGGNTGGGSSGGGGGDSSGSVAKTYTITSSADANGSISPSGKTTVNESSDKVFTITAKNGYRISDVTVDGKSVGTVSYYVFRDVKENHTIHVTFAQARPAENDQADGNGNDSVADPSETGVDNWLRVTRTAPL